MRKTRPKIAAQNRRIFGLASPKARAAGIETKDYIEETIYKTVPGNPSISALSFDESNDVIVALGGEAFRAYGHSKRNENHKKLEAGIKTVETEAHIVAIREAAALRNMGEEGLESLATRMRLPWPPHTTEQGNKIFEAVKAMNKRDNIVAFPTKPVVDKEPRFRRAA